VDYTSVKNILFQFWRYKTLAVIKRHNTTYLCNTERVAAKLAYYSTSKHTLVGYLYMKTKRSSKHPWAITMLDFIG